MGSDSPELSFLSLHAIISFFVFLIIQKKSNKLFNGALLDNDFSKPQAFHEYPIARSGGFASIIVLINFFILYFFLFEKFFFDYLVVCSFLFILGFIDDLKIKIDPNIRLLVMIIVLVSSILLFSINIERIDFIFLNKWLQNDFFKIFFVLCCLLFIINGANLIDGYNGLLGLHLIIINIILTFVNLENQHFEMVYLLGGQIIILITFVLYNFPFAKIFFGDSGSYVFGALTALNVIKTNNLNPEISSFFFCILLFYLFFEVFFSFFRKIIFRRSPLRPDSGHLHMLIYKKITKFKTKEQSNYLTSVIINLSFLLIVLPSLFFKGNSSVCISLFFLLLFAYTLVYYKFYKTSFNDF